MNNFEKVIIMFDQDSAGRKAAEDCAIILPPGKAFIATLSKKDANDVLVNGDRNELQRAVWTAKELMTGGLVRGQDIKEIVFNNTNIESIS